MSASNSGEHFDGWPTYYSAPPKQSCSPTTASHAGPWLSSRTTGKAEDKTTGKAEAKDKAIGAGRIRITAAGRSALED
jgi:hypothetical protein